jgi:diguanylate cyclase (GGDEF)-like protein
MSQDVIDYVFKGNMDDVNYIFGLIERLSKNRQYKVMVVDDSIVTRNEVKKILQEQMFQVFAAAHGEEALSYLSEHKDIRLILTDYHMPVIDGFELSKKVREIYSKTDLSIIAMTAVSEELISSRFLKIGANDFINKPFTKEELVCRVNNSIETLEYIEAISDMANTDFLTGVSNRRYFFKFVENFLQEVDPHKNPFAIAMLDIDDFKKINDTYGHDVGDIVIKKLAQILKENTKGSDLIARFGGEEFCLFLKDVSKEQAVEFFVKLRAKIAQSILDIDTKKIHFTVSIGVAFSDEENFEEMLNQADMALYGAKKNGKNRVEIAE